MSAWLSRRAGALVVLLVLVGWEVVSRLGLVRPMFFPPITTILAALWSVTVSLELPREYGVTLWRAAAAYSLATAAGIALGVGMGYSRRTLHLLEPLLESLRPIPAVAVIPVAILLLGVEHAMKIFIITWACFFPIWVNTLEGVRGVDRELIDTARTFKLTDLAIVAKIVIPHATPGTLTGMRISLAFALILSVVAEMVAGDTGIGYFLLDSERSFRIPQMYAGTLSLAMVGYSLNRAFLLLERQLLRWHHGYATAEPVAV